MNAEQNRCNFCGELKQVDRQYFKVKNAHFDDNKKGRYSDFIYYCSDCGIEVSDGYHTFDELYEHIITLFIELCRQVRFWNKSNPKAVWCSTKHSDGSTFGDWFVLGISKEKGKQITYYLPARFWSEVTDFAEILEQAPEWDGHTPADVLERLKML
jgi:hypothetical protein